MSKKMEYRPLAPIVTTTSRPMITTKPFYKYADPRLADPRFGDPRLGYQGRVGWPYDQRISPAVDPRYDSRFLGAVDRTTQKLMEFLSNWLRNRKQGSLYSTWWSWNLTYTTNNHQNVSTFGISQVKTLDIMEKIYHNILNCSM